MYSIAGLAAAIPPLLGNRKSAIWPWLHTELILLILLSILMLLFVLYLTLQQRQMISRFRQCYLVQEEAKQRSDRHCSRLITLFSVRHTLISETDIQRVFDCITDTCANSSPCESASLTLLDEKNSELVVRSIGSHFDKEHIIGMRQKIGTGISSWVAKHRKPVLLVSLEDSKKYPGLQFKVRSSLTASMVVPIIVRDEFVGILNVSAKSPDIVYDDSDLRILQVFADNVGTSIRHTEQANWIRQLLHNRMKSPIT